MKQYVPKTFEEVHGQRVPGLPPTPDEFCEDAASGQYRSCSRDSPRADRAWTDNSLELDLHSSCRLNDSSRNNKHDRECKTEEDNTHARVGRPSCNGSTPKSDSQDVEDRIPPLGNYAGQSPLLRETTWTL